MIYRKSVIYLVALGFIYFVAHFLLLFNKGIYWDGWLWTSLLYDNKFDLIYSLLVDQLKLPATYFIFIGLVWSQHIILATKIIVFVSWLVSGLALYFILTKRFHLKEWDSFLISAIFFLLPNFLSKLEITVVIYSIANAAFFLAAIFYYLAEVKKGLVRISLYVFCTLLFLVSFFMNSYLVFYGLFLLSLIIAWRKHNTDSPLLRVLSSFVKKYWLEIVLPIFFWIAKSAMGKPNGAYEGTYDFIFFKKNIFELIYYSIDVVWSNIVYGFFWPIINSVIILERKIFFIIFIILFSLLLLYFRHVFGKNDTQNMATSDTKTKNYYYFIIGALFFLVGIIPYLAVNKPPHPYGYGFSMRHTLLLPLGSSLIIIGLIGVLLVVNKAKYAIGGSIIALFMTMNIYNYYSADMDWYKQLAIINGLQEIKSEVSSKSILVFNDQLKDYNWLNRNIAILEYDGYINQIFNTNDKLGVSQEDYNRNYHQATLASILKYKEYYYLSAFQEDGETVFLNVDSPSKIKKPTLSNWAQLKIYEIFKPQEFNTKLEEVLDIKVNVVS